MLAHLRRLYAYTRWANARVVEACAALPAGDLSRPLGGSFPTVLGTLAHIAAADWVWLERWHGRSPSGAPAELDDSSLEGVRGFWDQVQDRREAWLAGLDEPALARVVAYRNTKGDAFEGRLGDLLAHVVNHSTYHRGQVVVYLRQLGRDAPATDLVLWQRLGEPAGIAPPR
jgi:uncharacterized damage-inducible protein DinB